jgi:hypothetical protein
MFDIYVRKKYTPTHIDTLFVGRTRTLTYTHIHTWIPVFPFGVKPAHNFFACFAVLQKKFATLRNAYIALPKVNADGKSALKTTVRGVYDHDAGLIPFVLLK